MAENSGAPASVQVACDRCHSRKIRCDRLDPCKNCASANTICNRLRSKTRPRKTSPNERIRLLTERMHQLENMIHDLSGLDGDLSDAPTVPGRGMGRSNEEGDRGKGLKRKRLDQVISISEDFLTHVPQPPSFSPTLAQARSTSINGMDSSGDISSSSSAHAEPMHTTIAPSTGQLQLSIPVMQRVALTQILDVLDEFNKALSLQDWSVSSRADAANDQSPYDLTPSDIISVLATPRQPLSSLHWSNSTLATSRSTETIGMELLDSKMQNESRTLPYKIILNFQVAMLLGRQKELPRGIQEHIELIKRRKFYDVLSKLDQISLRAPPSLHILRAQCMGVVILQLFGNVPEAWSMMVAASRIFVALGYDSVKVEGQIFEEDREACIAWCYQLDRSMSLLLRRPPLLPESSITPQISRSPLDDGIDWRLQLIQLNLDLTHIQGLMSLLINDSGKKMQWTDLEPLHNELNKLCKRLDSWEVESPASVSDVFVHDVNYLRFRGYATQTILLHMSTDLAKSSLLQQVAVGCARKCFESIRDLARGEQRFEMIDLSWDVLLYSLSPLCVLSYNIVRTRDTTDLKLLEDFARFIFVRIFETSTDNNPLATRIDHIYRSIINTCRSLVSAAPPTTTAGHPAYPTNHTPHRKNFMNFEHFFGGAGSATGPPLSSSTNETNQNRNGRSATNPVVEGYTTQVDGGTEEVSVTEEGFMRLLMYRVKIGWSD